MDILLLFFIGVILFVAGFLLGETMGELRRPDGLFIVNDSDYEKTKWIIDVNVDPKTIPNKKEVRLKVVKMDDEDV